MRMKLIAGVALAALCVFIPDVRADGVLVPFRLPNCPSALTLSAPGIFAGATNQQQVIDQLSSAPSTRGLGTIVLALTGPLEPSVVLVVAERTDTSGIQGKATQKQFDTLKTAIVSSDGQTEMASLNRRHRTDGIMLSNVDIVSTATSADSVTIIGLMNGSEPGADFTSYLGVVTSYVRQCIPSAIVVAPPSAMSKEQFETLMRSLSFN